MSDEEWALIAPHMTVLGQYAKGLAYYNPKEAEDVERELKRIKGYLWNGNHRQALPCICWLVDDLDAVENRLSQHEGFPEGRG